jgi:methanogenic corrinoid protein MtbC1
VNLEASSQRLLESLVNGDRDWARSIVDDARAGGLTPEQIVTDLFWPTYSSIANFFRHDQMSTLAHHMATRLLRTLVDQTTREFTRQARNGRTVFAVCGPTDADELAAQMAVDMLDRDGFTVSFAGGGIANDEVLERVQETHPDVLLLFASAPSDLPNVRELIDTLREIGACRRTQIVVGGGVFNRAEGLAEEIGADLWATDPMELVASMREHAARRAPDEQRTVGKKRKAPISRAA